MRPVTTDNRVNEFSTSFSTLYLPISVQIDNIRYLPHGIFAVNTSGIPGANQNHTAVSWNETSCNVVGKSCSCPRYEGV